MTDLVIYGATSAGIAAAVTARRLGKSVLLLEPGQRVGGLTTGGLGATDTGNEQAFGGISREFYQRIMKHYDCDDHWRWLRPEEERSTPYRNTVSQTGLMWRFEPSAALKVYQQMLEEADVPVVFGEALDREAPLFREGRRITGLRTKSGKHYTGKMFVDATYEGDLMALAGVSLTIGREANRQYGETLNGVQPDWAIYHQFRDGVDPWRVPGIPESGLLPGIDPAPLLASGEADRRIQAYCFRICLTDRPENRLPFRQPDEYDPLEYELLLRNFEAGEDQIPWLHAYMPNRKSDTNNRLGFSSDYIGANYDYPTGSDETRLEIVRKHRIYQQGLMWTLAHHPRVPAPVRDEVSRWGLCRDEFPSSNGWPEQLYIREARRMVGPTVMTQHHCEGRAAVEDPVALAAYTIDSHHVRRYVDERGFVRNEGDVQVGGFQPYSIAYSSLYPKPQECGNLLVPVCLSSSHIAFGSIRMEPVFMALGQAAATAASLAIDHAVALGEVPYFKLRDQLERDAQRIVWNA